MLLPTLTPQKTRREDGAPDWISPHIRPTAGRMWATHYKRAPLSSKLRLL